MCLAVQGTHMQLCNPLAENVRKKKLKSKLFTHPLKKKKREKKWSSLFYCETALESVGKWNSLLYRAFLILYILPSDLHKGYLFRFYNKVGFSFNTISENIKILRLIFSFFCISSSLIKSIIEKVKPKQTLLSWNRLPKKRVTNSIQEGSTSFLMETKGERSQ